MVVVPPLPCVLFCRTFDPRPSPCFSDRSHCPRYGVLHHDDLLVWREFTFQAHDGRAPCTNGLLSGSLPRLGDRLVQSSWSLWSPHRGFIVCIRKPNRWIRMKAQRVGYEEAPGTWHCGMQHYFCLLYTSPSPRDATLSRMPSSA